MKALTQTVADLSHALQRLGAENAFQTGVRHLVDQKDTALAAHAEGRRVSVRFNDPLEAEMIVEAEEYHE